MLKLNSSYIGYPEFARNLEFHGKTDSKEKFEKNSLELADWDYKKIIVNYVRNSYGHRSKDFSELNLDNYILCIGCSITEGVGIPVDTRYSDVLAKLMKCDLYNLALGGTGNDIIFYNLTTWFNAVKQRPKLVVIQWTEPVRFTLCEQNSFSLHSLWDNKTQDFIIQGDELGYFSTKTEMYKQLIRKIIDVPTIEIPWFTLPDVNQLNTVHIEDCCVDFARDFIHMGIRSNELFAIKLHKHIEKYNFCVT